MYDSHVLGLMLDQVGHIPTEITTPLGVRLTLSLQIKFPIRSMDVSFFATLLGLTYVMIRL